MHALYYGYDQIYSALAKPEPFQHNRVRTAQAHTGV